MKLVSLYRASSIKQNAIFFKECSVLFYLIEPMSQPVRVLISQLLPVDLPNYYSLIQLMNSILQV